MHDENELVNIDLSGVGGPDLHLVGDHLDEMGIPHEFKLEGHLSGADGPSASLTVSDVDGSLLPEIMSLKINLHGDVHEGVHSHAGDVHHEPTPDWTQPEIAAAELWGDTGHIEKHTDLNTPFGEFHDGALDWSGNQFTDFSIPEFAGHIAIHGTPVEDMQLWDEQQSPMSCAVATSCMMFRSIGLDISESTLTDLFQTKGIYDPVTGTEPSQIDGVLNDYLDSIGSDHHAEHIHGFDLHDMEMLLDAGIRPLIGLDATQLTPVNAMLNDCGIIPSAGHAVQLTGIIENEGQLVAILNDPGAPDGMFEEIPWEQFMHAASFFAFDSVFVV